MSIKGGYFKKRLHVDLTNSNAERGALSDAFIEKYIGIVNRLLTERGITT